MDQTFLDGVDAFNCASSDEGIETTAGSILWDGETIAFNCASSDEGIETGKLDDLTNGRILSTVPAATKALKPKFGFLIGC